MMQPGVVANLLSRMDRELWLITARAGDRRGGLIATFVQLASIVPEMPRVVVGLSRQHHTAELIEKSGAFALHLISEEQIDLVWRFGLQSGHQVDKFVGLSCRDGVMGSPLLADAIAWVECKVEARMDTGDRTVYLCEVVDADTGADGPFLTVARMLALAPADRLKELDARMQRDRAVDAEAIRKWRRGSFTES